MRQSIRQMITLLLAFAFIAVPYSFAEEAPKPVEGLLYFEDFEDGTMDGWVSYEDKSGVEQTDRGHSYCVKSYDYNSRTMQFTDYRFTFDLKAAYEEPDRAVPMIYVRKDASDNRYEMYIDAANGVLAVDRYVNGEQTHIGDVKADFAADSNEWIRMKIEVAGKNLRIFYKDMETPAAHFYDDGAVFSGSIGFGTGKVPFYVDNLSVYEMENTFPEPYEIPPDDKKDYKDSPYFEDIEKLIALKIVNSFDDGTFRPDNSITRAEFATLILRARNIAATAGGTGRFSDVSGEHWAAANIATVCALGYMSGKDDGTFGPDEGITCTQAAKVLVNLIGCGILAEHQGGYPAGYTVLAAQKGVTSGLNKSGEDTLTRGEVAKLLANTLEIDLVKQESYGGREEYVTQKGATLLSEYRDIYPYRGRVTANYFTGLYAEEALAREQVIIDEKTASVGETDIASQLGYCVKSYLQMDKSTGELTVIWYSVDEARSNALRIDAAQITGGTSLSAIEYFDSDNQLQTERLSKNTNLILNGGSGSFTLENLTPETGSITLIDADGDGVYEIVLAERYETMVAGGISAATGKVSDRFYPELSIALKETSNQCDVEIYRGYQRITAGDIAPKDVLSIARTEPRARRQKIKVLVSGKTRQGQIINYETGGELDTITVKDTEYPISSYYQGLVQAGLAEQARPGAKATLSLDSFGCVVLAEMAQASDFVLLNGLMWKNGADEGWIAEILTSAQEWQQVKLKSKLRYNGSTVELTASNLPQELLEEDGSCKKQIILAKINGRNEITELDTAGEDSSSGPLVRTRTYDWVEYVAASQSFDTLSYIDENTLVFAIPSNESDHTRYTASNSAYFRDGSVYSLWSYNEDEFEVADIVLVFEGKAPAGGGKLARPFIFDSIRDSLDETGEIVPQVTGYQEGEKKTFQVTDDALSFASYVRGDVLQLGTNARGEVVSCEPLYLVSNGETGSDNEHFGMGSDRVFVTGRVLHFDGAAGRLLLDVGNGREVKKAFVVGKAQSVYHLDRSKDRIYITSIGEIGTGDFVALDFSWNALRDVIIYR